MDDTAVGIYGYDGDASDGYNVLNLANVTATTAIAPGQGFLISADGTDSALYDIKFTPAMRTIGDTDDFIIGGIENEPLTFIKLYAQIDFKNHSTDFYFNDNASLGLDRGYDSSVYGPLTNSSLYSNLVEDNNNMGFAIQSLAPASLDDVIIPLGLKASQGQQVDFSIETSNLPAGTQVYLEDNETNTFTLLNSGSYTFTANSAIDGTGRFYLRVESSTLGAAEFDAKQIEIFTSDRTLFVNGQILGATTVNLYDLQGRSVYHTTLDNNSTNNQIDVSNLATGVYVVRLNNAQQEKTQKVIIK